MTTIESDRRDEEEFQAWWKTDCHKAMNGRDAYMAALKAERARSAGLVETLADLACYCHMGDGEDCYACEALAKYNQQAQ